MKVLGISCFYHDSAVVAVEDDTIHFAIHEERLTRIKQDSGFPIKGIEKALAHCNWDIRDVDRVAFYEDPALKLERLNRQVVHDWPRSWKLFSRFLPEFKKNKFDVEKCLRSKTGYPGVVAYYEHHMSHAAAAFYTSPFEESLILTVDGVGEKDSLALFHGSGNTIKKLKSIEFPDSLGLYYSVFTRHLGFKVNSGEYKVMGMACYGKPIYKDFLLDNVVRLNDDGSFSLNQKYFNFSDDRVHSRSCLVKELGIAEREPESEVNQVHLDLAASVQLVLEETVLHVLRHAFSQYGKGNLCMGGGVALNCTLNARIIQEFGVYPHIHPASGDAGGAMGCALASVAELTEASLRYNLDPYLGLSFSNEEVLATLDRRGVKYDEPDNLEETLADIVSQGHVVAVHWGRDEWGPRALGNRSILANPADPEMQDHLNAKIKFRESFRPFAPIVLEEHFGEYFHPLGAKDSPYMLFTYPVKKPDAIPAVTHVNKTGRVQTVNRDQHPRVYEIISRLAKKTGVPVIVNTSFNLRGEPIVGSPDDALNTFFNSGIDYLVLNDFLVAKHENATD